MNRLPHRLTRVASAALLSLLALPALHADDRDLLKLQSGKPYLFIALDTSASMNQAFDGSWVNAQGDDRRSKLFAAKKAIFEVMREYDNVYFGFAAFPDSNTLRVYQKHWLYWHNSALPAGWPFAWPRQETDNLVERPVCHDAADAVVACTAPGATVVDYSVDMQGDTITFGTPLTAPVSGTTTVGSCASPIVIGTNSMTAAGYQALDSLPIPLDGNQLVVWVKYGNGSGATYRMGIQRPATTSGGLPNGTLGTADSSFQLNIGLQKVSSCSPVTVQTTYNNGSLRMRLYKDFIYVGNSASGAIPGSETAGGSWDWQDVKGTAVCSTGHPHSGVGWEGNYDTSSAQGTGGPYDVFCANGNAASCQNLHFPTTAASQAAFAPELDHGDLIPLDWGNTNKTDFLQRLAPNYGAGTPDYGIASYFQDTPANGQLFLRDDSLKPLIGFGETPIAKTVADFRCFYRGGDNDNKCSGMLGDVYQVGWETKAMQNDPEWGCRKPYLIVISDGIDNCPGENACSDTANLNSKSQIQTWTIAMGANCDNAGNPLHCMAQNGKGDLVCPQDPTSLKDELRKIIGVITEQARTFASAAVPTVQTTSSDKVFVTNFTPLNGESIWDGHLHNFLKPLPVDPNTHTPDITSSRHVWDAGEAIKAQVQSPPYANDADHRRIYYSQYPAAGEHWGEKRLLWQAYADDASPPTPLSDEVRYDLWRATGLVPPNTATGSLDAATASSRDAQMDGIVDWMTAMKTATVNVGSTSTTINYILGDIFHSNPLVVDSPPNTTYYSRDVDGYRDFVARHENRRKILFAGANDGMLHAFDAGVFHETGSSGRGEFDDGTGKELFAYMPRAVMPTVASLPTASSQKYSVDGTPVASDVFIDPLHSGTPTPADRQWRTVIVTGLREGGSGYFALDITQPDTLTHRTETVNGVTLDHWVPTGNVMPSCLNNTGPQCSPIPFPAALWEFDDSVRSASGLPVKINEDGVDGYNGGATDGLPDNTEPDLGYTWSKVNIGRIHLCQGSACTLSDDPDTSKDLRDAYVAVFGGGMDPATKSSTINTASTRGNWVYMVDVETGKVIWKRRVVGSVPSEVAAVDSDGDGYFDRMYFGTTAGYIYRVDLAAKADDSWPALQNISVRGLDGVSYTQRRILASESGNPVYDANGGLLWEPRIIFNANIGATVPPRNIFVRPSVIWVPRLSQYALAFGTGDRENLWSTQTDTGRFFLFVDDAPYGTVMDETDLQVLDSDAANVSGDPIYDRPAGERGWAIRLFQEERLVNDPFALLGATVFSTYIPKVCDPSNANDPDCAYILDPCKGLSGDDQTACCASYAGTPSCGGGGNGNGNGNGNGGGGGSAACGKTGSSRAFVVQTTNANSLMVDLDNNATRTLDVAGRVLTEIIVEQDQTKNPSTIDGEQQLTPAQMQALKSASDALKRLLPVSCRFGNFAVNMGAFTDSTEPVPIAQVPVCIIEKNWKEF